MSTGLPPQRLTSVEGIAHRSQPAVLCLRLISTRPGLVPMPSGARVKTASLGRCSWFSSNRDGPRKLPFGRMIRMYGAQLPSVMLQYFAAMRLTASLPSKSNSPSSSGFAIARPFRCTLVDVEFGFGCQIYAKLPESPYLAEPLCQSGKSEYYNGT